LIRERMRRALQALVRSRSAVQFADPLRTEPVSRTFGLDRGTPIDRVYIGQFLDAHRSAIRGNVLEVGAATYTRAFGTGVSRSTVLNVRAGDAATTLQADLTDPRTLPEASEDCVICTQTLNMIFDVAAAVAGLRRLLRPGGCALVTVPGISQISRFDMDRWGEYWRFTDASLRRLFTPVFAAVAITSYGNVAAATAFLQGVAVEELPDRRVLHSRDSDYQVTLGVVARV
jgi:SAM-dependent methyltransferase